MTTSVFSITGLHCPSCQLLIEKRLIKEEGINLVDVSLAANTLTIRHRPSLVVTPRYLNHIFKDTDYQFSPDISTSSSRPSSITYYLRPIIIVLFLIFGFYLLDYSGFSSLLSVNSNSALPVFFLFGLLAGVSSCAALVGGLILSLSHQWTSTYSRHQLYPHLLFNFGRIVGFAIFGFLLGYLGNFFRLSPLFSALIVITISLAMILLGLQMLGVKSLVNFQFRLPKSLTGKIADESNFTNRFAPILMGALTFFLPCGFTITAQALALASGNPLTGALIMGLFALGTFPGLLVIGLSSVKFHHQTWFATTAGLLVLFFALFNINNQLAVLNLPNLSSAFAFSSNTRDLTPENSDLAPIINGQQLIKMTANSAGYLPNHFTIRANIPARWEITDTGTSGCTNAIISRSLFAGPINLVPGTTSVKEFTPTAPGTFRFSCWMGMISGTIKVIN